MSFDKTKLLLSFAILGFLIGSTTYYAFNWLIISNAIGILPIPILDIIYAPWFLSGIAGSLLSVIIIYLAARFSNKE